MSIVEMVVSFGLIQQFTYTFEDKHSFIEFIEQHKLATKFVFIQLVSCRHQQDLNYIEEVKGQYLPMSMRINSFGPLTELANKTVLSFFTLDFKEEKSVYTDNDEQNIDVTTLLRTSAKEFIRLKKRYSYIMEYFQSIVAIHPDVVFTIDLRGRFTSVNAAFEKTFGLQLNEIKGKSAIRYFSTYNGQIVEYFLKTKRGQFVEFETEQLVKQGSKESFLVHMVPITNKGKTIEIFVFARNITEQKQLEKRLERIAYYDLDTGLPNRVKFNEILMGNLDLAKAKKESLAVMFLDLDRFKVINDILGHEAGDRILIELAKRMQTVLSDKAILGKFGGDKFSMIFTNNISLDEVEEIGKSLLQKIQQPFIFNGDEYFVSASIGISVYPYDGSNHNELMKNADTALNRAKLLGGSAIKFYADQMNKEAWQRVEIERNLRRAIEREELFLTYQPIVYSDNSQLSACEALLRWNHPEFGLIPPNVFIPIAEETGLIYSIGNWVLENACKQTKDWQLKGFGDLAVSVNVSPLQFSHKNFIDDVKNVLNMTGIEPRHLHLEITESAMLNFSYETLHTMKALNELGVHISIDDFGTGYSSLGYLKNLPIHRLKIDRSFIQQLEVDSPDYAIVKAITTMGQGLGLNIVAEGVETKEQLHLLNQLGCNYIQGYYIERPMEPRRFEYWYNEMMKNT